MKKLLTIFALALALISIDAAAQGPRVVPDSLKYALNKFEAGRLTFTDGRVATGYFNFGYLDQRIRFKENNEILCVAENDLVKNLSAGSKFFTKFKTFYIETIAFKGQYSLCMHRRVDVREDATATAAYGFSDEASFSRQQSMRTVDNRNETKAQDYDLDKEIVLDYRYHEDYYLVNGNKIVPANMQTFKKFFSSKKNEIEGYCAEHNVDFDSRDDMIALFKFMSAE